MADDIRSFTVSVAAGTVEASPQVDALDLPQAVVERVDVIIPAGHGGETGIGLAIAGAQVIPFNEDEWITGDDVRLEFPLQNYPTTGQWSTFTWNTDDFDHTFYLTFLLSRASLFAATTGEFTPIRL